MICQFDGALYIGIILELESDFYEEKFTVATSHPGILGRDKNYRIIVT